MTNAEALRDKAVRFHLIADTILCPDASTDLHEAAAILEQQAEGLEDTTTSSAPQRLAPHLKRSEADA